MPIKAINTNYSGRTVDLELLQTVQSPGGDQEVALTLATPVARKVTGIEKLVQRYAMLLCTDLGSVRFNQNQGTDLLRDVSQGVVENSNLNVVFILASLNAVRLMQEDDKLYGPTYGVTIPDDERITSASLLSFDVDYTTATLRLTVEITAASGDSTEFVVPLTTG